MYPLLLFHHWIESHFMLIPCQTWSFGILQTPAWFLNQILDLLTSKSNSIFCIIIFSASSSTCLHWVPPNNILLRGKLLKIESPHFKYKPIVTLACVISLGMYTFSLLQIVLPLLITHFFCCVDKVALRCLSTWTNQI